MTFWLQQTLPPWLETMADMQWLTALTFGGLYGSLALPPLPLVVSLSIKNLTLCNVEHKIFCLRFISDLVLVVQRWQPSCPKVAAQVILCGYKLCWKSAQILASFSTSASIRLLTSEYHCVHSTHQLLVPTITVAVTVVAIDIVTGTVFLDHGNWHGTNCAVWLTTCDSTIALAHFYHVTT